MTGEVGIYDAGVDIINDTSDFRVDEDGYLLVGEPDALVSIYAPACWFSVHQVQ